jgi:hypothetical protein
MKQTEQQQGNEDLVLLIWQIEKLRRREGGCTMNELISEAKKNFEGIEQIKTKKIMEQTAVEYLVNQFRDAIGDFIINVMTEEIEQAKEMEKQQQGYSEEEVRNIIFKFSSDFDTKRNIEITLEEQKQWFEQFKGKNKTVVDENLVIVTKPFQIKI